MSNQRTTPRMDLPAEVIAAQLEEYRVQFEAGYSDALMHALLFCGKCGVPMPDWADWELHQAWRRFVNRSAENLGEAFAIEWPKNKHKNAYLKKRRLQYPVYQRVRDLHEHEDRPIDESLFADVGDEFHVGKRLASEYYYAVKKHLESGAMPIAVKLLLEPYTVRDA